MVDIRHFPTLTIHEKAILVAAGAIMAKLDKAHPCQIAFVSSDQYFVTFNEIAQVLLEMGRNAGMRAAGG